jgi:hypothetical protein
VAMSAAPLTARAADYAVDQLKKRTI